MNPVYWALICGFQPTFFFLWSKTGKRKRKRNAESRAGWKKTPSPSSKRVLFIIWYLFNWMFWIKIDNSRWKINYQLLIEFYAQQRVVMSEKMKRKPSSCCVCDTRICWLHGRFNDIVINVPLAFHIIPAHRIDLCAVITFSVNNIIDLVIDLKIE